ncbi:MFS transporter [Microbulbifer hainanensis]|uniref:MFS transporter n=1 Tax=Microbulbifer hainanensis TaxID=2735675 RepID=UPI001867A74F|nr:MFS transporter [Microbulbifer hainanensis]
MNRALHLALLGTVALLPQGISGQLYSAGAAHMAGTLALSQDEACWINILFLMANLCALPLGAWLTRTIGSRLLIQGAGALGLLCCAISAWQMSATWQLSAWAGHGMAAGLLTVTAQTLVLRNLGFRAIALVEGGLMLVATLLPMGVYPWILARLAEDGLWPMAFAVQLLPYGLLLIWPLLFDWPERDKRRQLPFNWLQATLTWLFTCSLGYLLLRGEHYNWLDSLKILETAQLLLVLGLALVIALRRRWGRAHFLRISPLQNRLAKLYMFDAVVAGFAILGTNLLIGTFALAVLQYSHVELGKLYLVGFGGMMVGLVFSLVVTSNPNRDPMKVVPLGVLLVLISSYWLSGGQAGSGLADMWPGLLVRGIAIGILNVTLTIHILRSFPRRHIPEGVALFYQFRTLGSLLAAALFGRLMYRETQSAANLLGQSKGLNAGTDYLNLPEQLGHLLLAGELKQQALAVAAVNNFRIFILAVLLIVPVMVIFMRWAKAEKTGSQKMEVREARPVTPPAVSAADGIDHPCERELAQDLIALEAPWGRER